MLVLTLEPGETFVLTDEHGRKVTIQRFADRPERFGITAPKEIAITRASMPRLKDIARLCSTDQSPEAA